MFEAFGVGHRAEEALSDHLLDRRVARGEAEGFAGGLGIAEAVFDVENAVCSLGISDHAHRPAERGEIGCVGMVVFMTVEE